MIYLAKIDKYPQEHLCPSTFRPVAHGLISLIPLKLTLIFYEFKVEKPVSSSATERMTDEQIFCGVCQLMPSVVGFSAHAGAHWSNTCHNDLWR